MKKLLATLLVLVMSFVFCACGNNESDSKSIEDRACEEVKFSVMAKIASFENYDGFHDITYSVKEVSENKFEISGKVTYKDKYSDTFTKKYDADVEYNPKTDSFDCSVDNIKIH